MDLLHTSNGMDPPSNGENNDYRIIPAVYIINLEFYRIYTTFESESLTVTMTIVAAAGFLRRRPPAAADAFAFSTGEVICSVAASL